MEVTAFVEVHAGLRDGEAVDRRSSGPSVRPNGGRRVVRHGYLPEREAQTGIGPVAVRCPRVRDRGAGEPRIRFTSRILPPYLRRAKSIEGLLPWLYVKGISTGDFSEAHAALLGPEAPANDRDVLLAFYDFPAERWKHIRSTNPIESPCAAVRLRTTQTKGCLSRKTALTMVFKLCQSAGKKWRRLDGSHHLAEIIRGVKFKDGEKLIEHAA